MPTSSTSHLPASALVVSAQPRAAHGPTLTALSALGAAVAPFGARIHEVRGGLVTLAADLVGPYWTGAPRDVLLAAYRARRATQPTLTFDLALGRSR